MNEGLETLELNHVALHVADLERSLHFYGEIMRFEKIPRPAFDFAGAWYRLGKAQELHLIAGRETAVTSHHRGNHFALRAVNLEAWQKQLGAHGIAFQPPKNRPDGAKQLFLKDPDGHVIELFTPPPER